MINHAGAMIILAKAQNLPTRRSGFGACAKHTNGFTPVQMILKLKAI